VSDEVEGPRALVITGPTATGKTDLAVQVAERLDGEVISADSRQVYCDLEIGTAKPDPALRARLPHHGLDLVDPDQRYSAGRFARDAWGWIREIESRGGVPVIVGGTGLFIRALLDPLAPEPDFDPGRRARLRRFLSAQPVDRLEAWLVRLDPDRAADLGGEGGAQRFARSLEVALVSGRPHSWWMRQPPETPALEAPVFSLRLPRDELYRRVDRRFDRMMETGLLDEVRELLERYPEDAPGFRTVGYAELVAHLREGVPLTEAVEAAKRSSRQYARRQLTWFRHQLPEHTVRLDARRPPESLAEEVVERWSEVRALAPGAGDP
jgi:tRNA dimethylallyltransferase